MFGRVSDFVLYATIALGVNAQDQPADKYADVQKELFEYVAVEVKDTGEPNLPAGYGLSGKYIIMEEFDGNQFLLLEQTIHTPVLRQKQYL